MSRAPLRLALAGTFSALAVCASFDPPRAYAQPVSTTTTATRTSNAAPSLSRQDIELARYIDIIEYLDLLENLDMVELLPVLEDSDANL